MYAKSGDLQTAKRVFDIMPEKSVVSWSAMIAAYGIHGQMIEAGSLFTKMVESGIRPNEVTFMNILSAFDLLSRAGDLDGAHRIIKSMLFPVDSSIWGAILNGCRIHGRKDLIRQINNDLQEISTDDTGYYTLLSNIYAEGGYLHESRAVRTKMEGMGLKKVPGYSTIEVDRKIYRFGAGNASESKEIYMFEEYLRSLGQLCDVEGYNNIFSEHFNIKELAEES
ncbi:putative pentatricopeptide repeat-containing protein At1g69350, mitochondrial [Arachis stenosperma]|uniref:putative pentatricopeptide repeat-containing protein At1g69350, mitochondrial n=1 Tax=Arachis stenosperma TaxID=217475 RepID=UPI0025AC0A66|nr:putative pentatricopeptide repeat-containing protein At1g69350, mitochondrial [Arachis stenosperma]